MGLKSLVLEFGIRYIVQKIKCSKTDKEYIAIGSILCPEIIIIDEGYKVRWGNLGSRDDKLGELYDKLDKAENDGSLKRIIEEKDNVNNVITVYTYKKGKVVKTYCEELGWPNLTVDGWIMFENTYFTDRKDALNECRKDATGRLKYLPQQLPEPFFRIAKSFKYFFSGVIFTIRSYLFFGH